MSISESMNGVASRPWLCLAGKSHGKKTKSLNNNPIVPFSVYESLPPKRFIRSNTLIFRAESYTEVFEYGPLNVHRSVQEEGLVKIGFTPHPLLANICL